MAGAGFEQEETEGTETSHSVISVCFCSKILIAGRFLCVSRLAHHPAMRDSVGERAKEVQKAEVRSQKPGVRTDI